MPVMALLVNRMIRGLLRASLLGRLAGKRLITVYLVGRKSGAIRWTSVWTVSGDRPVSRSWPARPASSSTWR